MTSPSKRVDVEKDNTMFGQLTNIEVHRYTIRRNKQQLLISKWLNNYKSLIE